MNEKISHYEQMRDRIAVGEFIDEPDESADKDIDEEDSESLF